MDPCKFKEFLVNEKYFNHPNGMVVLLKILPLKYTLIVKCIDFGGNGTFFSFFKIFVKSFAFKRTELIKKFHF